MSIAIVIAAAALLGEPIAPAVSAASPEEQRPATIGEISLRRWVTNSPLPDYPSGSLAKKRSGVAVASIVVGIDGRAITVDVLEAPDQEIGEAVKNALVRWTFTPQTQMALQATFTFYFQIAGGRGRVLNPQDMPGGPTIAAPAAARPGPPSARPLPRVWTDADAPANEVGTDRFLELLKTSRPTVLDIRPREDFARAHHEAAINIPLAELPVRGLIELDKSRPVVIDCARIEGAACRIAAHMLEPAKLAALYVFVP